MVDLNKSNQFTFGPQSQQSNFFSKPQTANSSFTFGQTGSQGSTTGICTNPIGGVTSTTSLYGGNPTQQTNFMTQPSSTNLFGSSTQPTTTNTSTGFFANKTTPVTNPSNTLFGSNMFNAPSTTSSLFSTSNVSNPLLTSGTPNYSTPLSNVQSVNNPYSNVFLISSVNVMKHDKIETLPEDVKKQIVEIENEINNNDIILDQTCKTINDLYSEFGLIKKEGQKMLNCLKLIYTKHQKISYIIEGLKNDVKVQNDFLEQNIRNYNILHNYPEMKINIPSQYFSKLAVEYSEKIDNFKKELSELETIIQLTYQNEIETENDDIYDIVEKFIQEIYNSLRYFISECVMLNEKTKNLKLAFFNHMKNNYNVKESELELRYKIYLEKNFKGQKI